MKYQCCFCGTTIESQGKDVSSLLLTTNWDGMTEQQQSQQFFCHFECFKKTLQPGTPVYIKYE